MGNIVHDLESLTPDELDSVERLVQKFANRKKKLVSLNNHKKQINNGTTARSTRKRTVERPDEIYCRAWSW